MATLGSATETGGRPLVAPLYLQVRDWQNVADHEAQPGGRCHGPYGGVVNPQVKLIAKRLGATEQDVAAVTDTARALVSKDLMPGWLPNIPSDLAGYWGGRIILRGEALCKRRSWSEPVATGFSDKDDRHSSILFNLLP
jgi:hypothetical protein